MDDKTLSNWFESWNKSHKRQPDEIDRITFSLANYMITSNSALQELNNPFLID
jgi:hypothetical protein